jgi:hypothetical protein
MPDNPSLFWATNMLWLGKRGGAEVVAAEVVRYLPIIAAMTCGIGVVMTFEALERRISGIRPLFYLLFYVAMIPVWGAIYTLLTPHGFYAPYARLEPSAKADGDNIAEMLTGIIRTSLRNHNEEKIVSGDWQLNPTTAIVDSVGATDTGQLTFRLRISADGINSERGNGQLGWAAVVTIDEQPVSETLGEEPQIFRLPEITQPKYVSPFNSMSSHIFELAFASQEYGLGSRAPVLPLNAGEDRRLRLYLQGARGDPEGFSSEYPRMVYLSVVIITTLGLGDIVPISPESRFLVGFEAVTGVLTVGLFLNSLAYRASKGK